MPEPTTPNTALIIPNTGDLVGTWGSAAVNPDFLAIDGMFGGTVTIGLSVAATTVLTLPSGVITPSAGPTQSQNAGLIFSGTLTGNNIIVLGMPGRYTMHNQCLPWTFYVQVVSSGGGRAVGLPPGKKVTLYHDGTNVDFVDTLDVGTAYDLHGVTSVPAWMTACTVAPYLVKDGTIYSMSQYPFLGNLLKNAFGGDGVTTFAVPDERARMRIAYDPGSTGRMTSPVNASVMGSNGGEQSHTLVTGEIPAHTHGVTDPGHSHTVGISPTLGGNPPGNGIQGVGSTTTSSSVTGVSIQSTGGGGAHDNVQPSIISFLALIKT